MVKLYFSDFFDVSADQIENYGAFNVSLINDVPLFVDPFLLFTSTKPEYRRLHDDIIRYVTFLRDKASAGAIDRGLLAALFTFHEVKQNWLGFSEFGNRGSGLGTKFAKALHSGLQTIFSDFGTGRGDHVERLCLIEGGVGRDNVSDFTTTLIKAHLLEYTQTFARKYLRSNLRSSHLIEKVSFDYPTESWMRAYYELPTYQDDYVLLTPKDILTRDEIWIGQNELLQRFKGIAASLPNEQIRAQLDNYFQKKLSELPPKPKPEQIRRAKLAALKHYPALIDHYVSEKVTGGRRASFISRRKVTESEQFYVTQAKQLAEELDLRGFYRFPTNTRVGSLDRLRLLKEVIEGNNGYRLLHFNGAPISREDDLQRLFRIVWSVTPSSPRGKVDVHVVAKLASNRHLEGDLLNRSDHNVRLVVYYDDEQYQLVNALLNRMTPEERSTTIVINAANTQVESAEDTQRSEVPRTQVFISYSHTDKEWLAELQLTLKPYMKDRQFDVWDDTRLKPGESWREEITKALKRAKVAVLLVSRNFFASDFITDNELPILLEAAENAGLTVFWIAVSPSLYKRSKIASYQAANDPAKPLDSLTKAELGKELVSIAERIEAAMVSSSRTGNTFSPEEP